VGVLTGPHPAARLHAAGATHVINTIADLPAVLPGGSPPPSVPRQAAAPSRLAGS
jgi:hypothetical protein